MTPEELLYYGQMKIMMINHQEVLYGVIMVNNPYNNSLGIGDTLMVVCI
jgi:hypothetical protein